VDYGDSVAALPSPSYELSGRQRAILERLEQTARVEVTDLSKILGVSEVTIRKDLQELEQLSLLKRVHGGAISTHRTKWNPSLENRLGAQSDSKLAIAKAAIELVHDGDTLILDAGTTTLALARHLRGRRHNLTVITNSLPVLAELSNSDYDLVVIGGMFRQHSLAMIGPLAVACLAKLHADIAFVGATAASLERGLCTPNIIEAETKAAMVKAASERVALIDYSKIGQASLAPFASWTEIQALITDETLDVKTTNYLQNQNVKVVVAQVDTKPQRSVM
jgi:DeoR family transcriptional regulator, fructose operon transcriptional repressor